MKNKPLQICANCDHVSDSGLWCNLQDIETDINSNCRGWLKDTQPEERSDFVKEMLKYIKGEE